MVVSKAMINRPTVPKTYSHLLFLVASQRLEACAFLQNLKLPGD